MIYRFISSKNKLLTTYLSFKPLIKIVVISILVKTSERLPKNIVGHIFILKKIAVTQNLIFYIIKIGLHGAVGQGLGVTIVRNVKNPPTAAQIVELCVLKGIRRVRVYDGTKDRDIIKAISDTFAGLQVLVGVGKDDVYRIASDLKAIEAQKWLNANVVPFDQYVNFLCILVGNDHMVQQGNREMWAVYWALAHLKMAQRKLGLNIFLGIAMDTGILTESFPPSAAEFIPSIMPVFRPLYETDLYYEYKGVPIGYALLDGDETLVTDNGLAYTNMMDGIVDAFQTALAKMGYPYMRVLVGETGWSSGDGGQLATPKNAGKYLYNLAERLKNNQGTPMKPNRTIETYIHTLYVQDNIYMGLEKWYGMFNTDNSSTNPYLALPA
ncbi:Putative glucan endo-1,3-beta-glucosidase GVI (Fragment) [Linum grandiflorum]